MFIGKLLLSIIALGLSACAAQQVQLTAAPGQEAVIRDGRTALFSRKKHVVMVQPNTLLVQQSDRPAFTLAVRNMGRAPENLMTAGIAARQRIHGKLEVIKAYRYDELVQEENTRQAFAAFAVALGGVGRAMSASQAGHVTTTGTVHSYGGYGGTFTASTYDPYRAQMAQQVAANQTDADFAAIRAQGEQNLAQLQRTILKDNTVMPGEWIGGTIILAPPTQGDVGASYSIVVEFGGEEHEFTVAQVKR